MRQIAVREADAAGTVLARAFALDPLWVYLLPDRTQRAFVLRQSFRATVPWYSRNGQVYGVGDPLRGVAVWSVPGQAADSRWSLLNVNTITLLASPLALVFRKVIPIFAQFERMHARYAHDPHFYLNTIGVVPEAHGQGLASQLIKPVLAQADQQMRPVYTETMTPSNVPLYEHFGFQCREQFSVPTTALHIWALYRPVQS